MDRTQDRPPCPEGRCGPIVTPDDDDYNPLLLGPVPNGYQYGYCERCQKGWRWDVPTQQFVPWDDGLSTMISLAE